MRRSRKAQPSRGPRVDARSEPGQATSRPTRYDRRSLLGRAGLAASGVVVGGQTRIGTASGAAAARPSGRGDRFGRIFDGLEPFAQPTDAVKEALLAFGAKDGPLDARDDMTATPLELILNPGRNPDSTIVAGMTFLGQFVDHDVTFDLSSQLGVPTVPEMTRNFREPALNLDSVYGGGYGDLRYVLPDGTLRVETCDPEIPEAREDLPRIGSTAVIADPRNDENLMLASLHAAILCFHNAAHARTTGSAQARFEEARRLTRWHYQWVVLHEMLPAFVGKRLVDRILRRGRTFYRPRGEAFIPVEFQIAYRLHSLARPSYRANFTGGPGGGPLFLFLFDPSQAGAVDPDDLRGGQRSPRRFIDWQTFFGFPGYESVMRTTKKLDRLLSTPLFTLPLGAIASGQPPTVLAQRNFLRHLTWSVPSGQRLARKMKLEQLSRSDLPELAPFGQGLDASTPLWHYVNAEAELVEDGQRLGPLGGTIVAEVLVGLLELDATSFLSEKRWRPTLPAAHSGAGEFRMIDFLAFAGVAPTTPATA